MPRGRSAEPFCRSGQQAWGSFQGNWRSPLTLCTLQNLMAPSVARIFDSTFQCTLEMIKKNFEDFPDHRLFFFKVVAYSNECNVADTAIVQLLRAVNKHCFSALLRLQGPQFQLVMDSIL